ncbi:MAG: PspC domain-containing protein [Actinomycetota bacterium]|nr:PspC domain-containing protein [Actinomycetota bacterium]
MKWSGANGGMGGDVARARLSRSTRNHVIAGVCGGLAEYYGISSTRIRWAFAVFGLFGAGEVVYIVLWIVLPKGA